MPIEFKRAYLEEIRLRYRNSTKKQKGTILDEFCEVCKITRKHAIRILKGTLNPRIKRPGPEAKYGPELNHHLKILWEAMNQMCSKKMVAAFPLWLPFYKAPEFIKKQLLQMSASTIDRRLRLIRNPLQKGLSSTRAQQSWVKRKIPIKLLDAEVGEPGYIEADTVAHCGESLQGKFIYSVTMTDLYSGWTENRAVLGKEGEQVLSQINSIEKRLPFQMLGFACDNGTEFLNERLYDYFTKRSKPVEFVRRRPYKKNDAAHVEQKNWTHVRELFGYDRLEDPVLLTIMNEIYQAYWNPLWNYFTPVLKLISKERVGGSIKKHYDKPKTPYHRLMSSSHVDELSKGFLKDKFETKNPFYLKSEMDKKLKDFFAFVEMEKQRRRLTGS